MKNREGTPFHEFESELLDRPGVRREYDALKPRYEMIRALIERRIQLGFSQTQLAALIGTKQPAISRLEKGDADTTLNTLFKVATALDLDVSIKTRRKARATSSK